MSPPVLEVDVSLPLDRFDLRLDFAARRPVTGIFGPSGAGKSSLLEVVAGLRRGAGGRVRLGDETWLDAAARIELPPERRRVGYVPQDGLLFPHLDVRRNLLAGTGRAAQAGARPEELLRRVAELLELTPLLDRSVAGLSGGERQRVALGRALCSGPRLLLLDEPLAALDLPLRRRLLPFLRQVCAELTVPAVLVSHDPIEVQALCDEIVVLRRGEAIARGAPREVLTDPAVFPLAEREGFENVLPGRIVGRRAGTTVVRLGDGLEVVTVPREPSTEGDVLVGLPANEILIATEEPRGLSARNALPARIVEIRPVGTFGLVTAELAAGLPSVAIEVTEATPADLGLVAGRPIFLVFKATSCRLYGRR